MNYELIIPYLHLCKSIKAVRGQIIYSESETPQGIYFIRSGLIGLFHITESGRETFLRIFNKNSYLGHRSFLAKENYHATSIALHESELILIPKSVCSDIFKDNPDVLLSILAKVAKDLAVAEVRLAKLQDNTANQRIAETLLFLKLRYPDIVWTRKEIGEYSCSSLESVTRLMTKLEVAGIIKKTGRDFTILNEERLIEYND